MIAIQPRCEMDEKAKILRIWVWLRPAHPPKAVDKMARVVRSVGFNECEVRKSRVIGGSFMTVESRSPVVREVPWRTSGNQKWNGARPSFIAMAAVRSKHDAGCVSCVMSHCPVCHALTMPENSTSVEAAAWTRKYLVAASMARGWCDFEIKGRMANVLISRPVQARIQ